MVLVFGFNLSKGLFPAVGVGLSVWLMAGALQLLARRARVGQGHWTDALRRAMALPRSTYGVVLAHFGLGAMVFGVLCAATWKQEATFAMAPGDTKAFAGHDIRMLTVGTRQRAELRARAGGSGVQPQRPGRDGAVAGAPLLSGAAEHHDQGGDPGRLRSGISTPRSATRVTTASSPSDFTSTRSRHGSGWVAR